MRVAQFCTIFLGAFLIFQIQPIVGKIVTPRFGGTSAVWTCCLLFFQLVLLAGYLFTYVLSNFSPRKQAIVYGSCFLVSICLFSVKEPAAWEVGDASQPVLSLITILSKNLFAQCLLLSSVSGMIQLWYRLSSLGSPYWLYALSNVGSLGALISYPLLIEPNLKLDTTIGIWNGAYVFTGVLILASAVYVFFKGDTREKEALALEGEASPPGAGHFILWCFLTAMTSAGLICYTQHLTQDIAPVPLLWVAPLVLFLLTYIICFAKEEYCKSRIYLLLSMILWIMEPFLWQSIELNTACILAYVFCFSMALHSELVKSKPKPKYLAVFYLCTAIGGALGGLMENLLAPQLLNFFGEKILFFLVLVVLFLHASTRSWIEFDIKSGVKLKSPPGKIKFALGTFFILCISILGMMIADRMIHPDPAVIVRMRDFYGCVSVEKTEDSTSLIHGKVVHGTQLNTAGKEMEPTRYFASNQGFNYALKMVRERFANMKCAVLGLGAGTIACYSKEGDKFVYYEIDPNVIDIARRYFTFLKLSPADNEVILGDGRIVLERSEDKFDLLVMDAFNGNAVPVHLLTVQAFEGYLKHLNPNGFILVNISNRHVNLEPVLGNLAKKFSLQATTLASKESTWVLISRQPYEAEKYREEPRYQHLRVEATKPNDKLEAWTDDYSNVMSVLIHH